MLKTRSLEQNLLFSFYLAKSGDFDIGQFSQNRGITAELKRVIVDSANDDDVLMIRSNKELTYVIIFRYF